MVPAYGLVGHNVEYSVLCSSSDIFDSPYTSSVDTWMNFFILLYFLQDSNNVCVPNILSFVYSKDSKNELSTCDCAAKCIICVIL